MMPILANVEISHLDFKNPRDNMSNLECVSLLIYEIRFLKSQIPLNRYDERKLTI